MPPAPTPSGSVPAIAVVQGRYPAGGHEHHCESDAARRPDEKDRRAFPVDKEGYPDDHEQDRKEPCHVAEKLEQEIGEPRADEPPAIDDVLRPVSDRPARIAAVIARHREREEERGRREPDEGRFAPSSAERLGEQL